MATFHGLGPVAALALADTMANARLITIWETNSESRG